MIVWLAIQLHQFIYGVPVGGMELDFLRTISFLEILIEITAVLAIIGGMIHALLVRED